MTNAPHPTCRCGFEADVLDADGTPWCSMHLPVARPTTHLRTERTDFPNVTGALR